MSRERSAKSEKEGARSRVSPQSTTVDTGGGQLLPEGAMRKNSGVTTHFPITHVSTLRRLLALLPRRTMMAEGGGVRDTGWRWADLLTPGILTPPALQRALHSPGEPSLRVRPRARWWDVRSYLGVSIAGASPRRRPGTTCSHRPGPTPPPPSAAATHSHHGRHRIPRVRTHFIVETTPARVGGGRG